jgi:hypothetical protein
MGLHGYCRRLAIMLTIIGLVPILLIRAQPYVDHVIQVLVQDRCAPPCFMRIRPGQTTMSEAYHALAAHDWVANTADEFPSLIRQSALYGAGVPRTVVNWRWSAALPVGLDAHLPGSIIFQDHDVLALTINTGWTLGELLLTLGKPDDTWLLFASSPAERAFEVYAWYANEGMLIKARGVCPAGRTFGLPIQITFHATPPVLAENAGEHSVC